MPTPTKLACDSAHINGPPAAQGTADTSIIKFNQQGRGLDRGNTEALIDEIFRVVMMGTRVGKILLPDRLERKLTVKKELNIKEDV